MSVEQSMSFEQFKDVLTNKYGRVNFRECGKHGWTSVEDILDRKPGGNPGPHWCDAANPKPNSTHLFGRYNFNTSIATFFCSKCDDSWTRAKNGNQECDYCKIFRG
jgi:hypothetical protein